MWLEGIRLFGEATGAKATYEYKPIGAFIKDIPDRMLGEELGDKFLYSHEPGYDGADKSLLRASDIRKVCLLSWTREHELT